MNKLLSIIIALVLSVSLVSCAGSSSSSNATNNNQSNNATTSTTDSKYISNFPYIPNYNGMQFSQYTSPSQKMPYAQASYMIKNTTDKEVFEKYENILKSDGWTITEEQKYYSISAKKADHLATFDMQKANKDVRLIIIAT